MRRIKRTVQMNFFLQRVRHNEPLSCSQPLHLSRTSPSNHRTSRTVCSRRTSRGRPLQVSRNTNIVQYRPAHRMYAPEIGWILSMNQNMDPRLIHGNGTWIKETSTPTKVDTSVSNFINILQRPIPTLLLQEYGRKMLDRNNDYSKVSDVLAIL